MVTIVQQGNCTIKVVSEKNYFHEIYIQMFRHERLKNGNSATMTMLLPNRIIQ